MPTQFLPEKPQDKAPAEPDPTRHQFGYDTDLDAHDPYQNPDAAHSPSMDGKITVTAKQLAAWSTLFDDAATKLNLAGDYMTKIKVEPGYFQEADTVRDLVSTFNSTFVPNTRVLSDSSAYVSRALQLVAKEFGNVENVNLDKNTNLTDLVSSLTKLGTGLKTTAPVTPNTPSA